MTSKTEAKDKAKAKIKVISGGQTGIDQIALEEAASLGIKTGGTACKGWYTETGPKPDLEKYGLIQCSTPGYPARTRANVRNSNITIIYSQPLGAGLLLRNVYGIIYRIYLTPHRQKP